MDEFEKLDEEHVCTGRQHEESRQQGQSSCRTSLDADIREAGGGLNLPNHVPMALHQDSHVGVQLP